jgi:hypothetical protein
MLWNKQLLTFYKHLQPPARLPGKVQWLYPQQSPQVMQLVQLFLDKYYSDTGQRRLILGINPGRFGAGITGINFTAPRQLTDFCGIPHSLGNSSELSAEFIYDVVMQHGGPEQFYAHWFIGAVCPLGFVQQGKNINYYDDKKLQAAVTPFIVQSLQQQVDMGFVTDRCICIGGEKNYRFLSALNEQHHWFDAIVPLPHPRFIMQYRRRQKQQFVEEYLKAISL